MSRRSGYMRVAAIAAVLWGCCGALGQQSQRVYCNITAIETRRLINAVQITIRADGLMNPDIQSRDLFNVDAARMGHWEKMGKRVEQIPIRIWNARSQVGSIANVGIYPVSHVEITVPPEASEGIGVDIRIVLYKPAMTRDVRLAHDRWNFDAEGESPPFISIEQSQDRRSIVVIVTSDRRTVPPPERRSPDASKGAVAVQCRDGLLSVDAGDADIREVLREVSRATGREMVVDPSLRRAASLYLDGVTLEDALFCIGMTYGLSIRTVGKATYISDPSSGTGTAYGGGSFASIPLHHISAAAARDSLPDFLLGHVQVDAAHNALMVSGPTELVRKVGEDVARLDRPVPMVEVTVTAVEFQTSDSMEAVLGGGLAWRGGKLDMGLQGDLFYSVLGQSAADLNLTLHALAERRRVRIRAETRQVVLNGRTARLFVGRQKRLPARYFDFWTGGLETRILTVQYGTTVEVTPWTAGRGEVTTVLRSDVSDVTEVERFTGNPTLSRRTAETTVRVRDGDVLMIGGLSQRQTSRAGEFLPLISAHSRTEPQLAVFVSTRIVGSAEEVSRGAKS